MCRGYICMYRSATFEYFELVAAVVMQSVLYKQPRKHHITAVPQDAVQSIEKPQGATAN